MTLYELQTNIEDLEAQIASLPPGNISVKMIKGKAQPYLQWTESGRRISRYIKVEERDEVMAAIERKKRLTALLKELRKQLPQADGRPWDRRPERKRSGTYFNPGNSGFTQINDSDYVDKTMLIDLINQRIGTPDNLICVSRPRRFGKSFAARMLSAYYDCGCDSHGLFDDKKIAETRDYERYLNQYNVIYLDMTGFLSQARIEKRPLSEIPAMIEDAIWRDLVECGYDPAESETFCDFLIRCTEQYSRKQFIFIIDEWDALIREAKDDPSSQESYLHLLRKWFKNGNFTPRVVAAAYMTGILPIKKDGSQSAVSDFREYTMLKPRQYGEFVGFTEREVQKLCAERDVDFSGMKQWYDGYSFPDTGAIYNPNSVMLAAKSHDFDSYWTETSAAEGLLDYISQDYNGLSKTIAELIGGVDVKVNTTGFANDLTTFKGKDDVLTLMIHLGYLAYDSENRTARIPNEEIRQEFQRSIHEVKHEAALKRLEESEKLFTDTILKNEEAVARQIEKVHLEETTALHYNREDSLRSVIKLAYYSYRDHYLKFEELPAGNGYADIVYYPRPDSDWPVLVIELKWNQDAEGAIQQILDRKYPAVFADAGRTILLVGITYDRNADSGRKKHSCRIVEY